MLTKNTKLIKSCRAALIKLLRQDFRKYIELFFWEKEVSDQVWAILPHETPQIINRLKIKKGDVVLDLATGSGAIALFCADKAKKVYAIDINPRAIEYAKFNAILNNLERKIEFRIGDLFAPVKNIKFDYIVWNGPTVAAPNVANPSTTYALSDFGGPDGAEFTRRFINQVSPFMKKDSAIMFYDSCLGNKQRSVAIDYLAEKFEITEKFPLKNIITPNFIFKEWHFMKETEIKTTLSADWAGLPSATF